MRIGELAELVGVSTRTVRHYHRRGRFGTTTGGG
ncbi:MerR family DNA-binding transcriptional regulator [Saccharopolyspora erythraea]|nr:MerR family DNA-binding transcriptional regulator [Saccharopolyspora erythraea]